MALCLVATVMVGSLYPISAFAVGVYDNYPTLIQPQNRDICPIEDYNGASQGAREANRWEYGLMKRMVMCVQGLVIPATYRIMVNYSNDYFFGPVMAACTLAVAMWGYLMVVGKHSPRMRDAFMVAVKIGVVSMFTYVMGKSAMLPDGAFPIMIDVVDDLARVVTTYIGYSTTMNCASTIASSDVWGRVDCMINTLIGGIFDPQMLVTGLLGFFVTALFSGGMGLFIALAGFAIIFFLLMAILRATYITIAAYVALALMALVSPIFITLLLFAATRAYFEKWLRLTINFMLQPLFLFAYLAMMLAAFDTVIYDGKYSVYRSIVPEAVIGSYPAPLQPYGPNNNGDFLIGHYLIPYYQEGTGKALGVGADPGRMAGMSANSTGVLGTTAGLSLPDSDFKKKNPSGIAMSVLDQFKPMNVYKVEVPFQKINWIDLALNYYNTSETEIYNDVCSRVDCGTPAGVQAYEDALDQNTIDYLIQLFLSLLIAVLTMYLFYLLLDALPFIGSGVAGEKMPSLGHMSMPGNNVVAGMKEKMKLLGGGK